jgi:hypothetical protein
MVDTKAGCFGRSLPSYLPLAIEGYYQVIGIFDILVAWRVPSTHRDEDCDVAQHGQSTKNVADLFLISIPGRLEVVDHDKAPGLFQGIEFRNDLFECYLLVSRRVADVASIHGTQTMFPPGNHSLMRGNSTMASETEVFSIPPGPRMQTREVSSRRSKCAIPSTKSSRPWKISAASLVESVCPIQAASPISRG